MRRHPGKHEWPAPADEAAAAAGRVCKACALHVPHGMAPKWGTCVHPRAVVGEYAGVVTLIGNTCSQWTSAATAEAARA